MKSKLCFLFSVFSLCSIFMVESVWAQMPGVTPSQESPEGMITINSEDDVLYPTFTPGIVYAKYGDVEQHINLIQPFAPFAMPGAGGGTPAPLIIYVEGSAWFPQEINRNIPQLAEFTMQTGYAIASVEYRPSTIAQSPAQLQDVKAAIRFMRANAAQYNIDPERIAVWGGSSGGHMSALVGTTDGLEQFLTEDNPDQSTSVKAVVDFFGPTNFIKMQDYPSMMDHNAATSPESSVIGGLIQAPENYDKVQAYNPITYISAAKDLPPFLIMHGDEDPLVPFNQSVLLYEALTEANQDVTFYKIKGAGHGSRFWTPSVIKIVQEFLAENL